MRERLTVLFLAADPFRGEARLELGEEMRAIDEAIRRGSARDSMELVSHLATRTSDLQYALLRHEPHIVHFAGHGGAEGIYLGDEHGQPRAVGKEALGGLFGILKCEVRAVVLNGCHTLPVADELRQVVDFAIGTRRRIGDGTAIGFAAAFYTALAFGQGVRQAFALAVNQLQVDGSSDADVPVLRTRDGAADTPMLAAPTAKKAVGTERDIDQQAHVREMEDSSLDMVGRDHRGCAPAGRVRVNQDFVAGSVKGSQITIVGDRSGPHGV